MYTFKVVTQDVSTGNLSQVFDALRGIAGAGTYSHARIAVAYASLSGCKALIDAMPFLGYGTTVKRWLISIDSGVTEPEALSYLGELPHSYVRVPGGVRLLDAGLKPARSFHPKAFVFSDKAGGDSNPYATLVGSANLTASGLHTNVEQCVLGIWIPPLKASEQATRAEIAEQLTWWRKKWDLADRVDGSFIKRYAELRKPVHSPEESSFAKAVYGGKIVDTAPAVLIRWATARCFWIETPELYKNNGPYKAGNQLDCQRGTRVYFGFSPLNVSRNTRFGFVEMKYIGNDPVQRSVRFANNSMDKVNLPVPGKDGPHDYDNRVLHFERVGSQQFVLRLAKAGDAAKWRDKSQTQHLLYSMAGGRAFGFYS